MKFINKNLFVVFISFSNIISILMTNVSLLEKNTFFEYLRFHNLSSKEKENNGLISNNKVNSNDIMFNKYTQGKNWRNNYNFYLNQHNLDCGFKQIIQGFQLYITKSLQIGYKYACKFSASVVNSSYEGLTSWKRVSDNYKISAYALDKLNVKCKIGFALQQFRLVRIGRKISYKFRCVKTSTRNCKTNKTNETKGNIILGITVLDKLKLNVGAGKALTQFALQTRKTNHGNFYHYSYTSCELEIPKFKPSKFIKSFIPNKDIKKKNNTNIYKDFNKIDNNYSKKNHKISYKTIEETKKNELFGKNSNIEFTDLNEFNKNEEVENDTNEDKKHNDLKDNQKVNNKDDKSEDEGHQKKDETTKNKVQITKNNNKQYDKKNDKNLSEKLNKKNETTKNKVQITKNNKPNDNKGNNLNDILKNENDQITFNKIQNNKNNKVNDIKKELILSDLEKRKKNDNRKYKIQIMNKNKYFNLTNINRFTLPRDIGNGTIYHLTFHNVNCGKNRILQGFHSVKPKPNFFSYEFECIKNNIKYKKSNFYIERTQLDVIGKDDKKSINYLDRHDVSCKPNYALQKFRLIREGSKIAYIYRCIKSKISDCKEDFTLETLANKDFKITDLDKLLLTSGEGRVLSQFKLKVDNRGDKVVYKYIFTSCKLDNIENNKFEILIKNATKFETKGIKLIKKEKLHKQNININIPPQTLFDDKKYITSMISTKNKTEVHTQQIKDFTSKNKEIIHKNDINPNIPRFNSQQNENFSSKKNIKTHKKNNNPNIPPFPSQKNKLFSKKIDNINKININPNIPPLIDLDSKKNTTKVSLKVNNSDKLKNKKSSNLIIKEDKGNEFCSKNCIPNLKDKPKLCYSQGVKVCFSCSFNIPISLQENHDPNILCSKACRSFIGSTKCEFYSLLNKKKY